MPVNDSHAQYDVYADLWQRCRDVFAGEDAVKAGGTRYLPLVSEKMKPGDYEAYKTRALFYSAMARTVQGLAGLIFRKDPEVTVPDALQQQLADCTLTGAPFSVFAQQSLQDVLIVGRFGVLLDVATEEASRSRRRPYLVGYPAERIVNWQTIQRNGESVLSLVVLSETQEQPDTADKFRINEIQQYRVLELDAEGYYKVSLWASESGGAYKIIQEYEPRFALGDRLDFIPFCFFGPSGISPAVEKPPLLDLANVNLSHYRSSADLEHARHFCALPTAVFTGFKIDTDKPVGIGSSQAIISEDPSAKAEFLEFKGQGVEPLERALESKEGLMAVLGARLLEPQKRAAETAETLRLRQAGESAVLRTIANTASQGFSLLLKWWALWGGFPADPAPACLLNTDFVDSYLNPEEIKALVTLWQSGGISHSTLYANLQAGEITRPGVSFDQEKSDISADAPFGEI